MRNHPRPLRSLILSCLLGASLVTACGDDDPTPDSGFPDARVDAGSPSDASAPDSGRPDLGTPDSGPRPDAGDAGGVDAGPEELSIPGLSAPARISYDQHGVTHLGCQTNNDCFAVQGYIHAAHRFGQMDLRRRFVRGRLAELFGVLGETILNVDRQSRSFIATRNGDRLEATLWNNATLETKHMLTAYTRGVNAWIQDLRNNRNGARLTEDWNIGVGLVTDWEELDSVACILSLLESLTNESSDELTLGDLASKLEPETFMDLYGLMPGNTSTILPPTPGLRAELADGLEAVRRAKPRLEEAQRAIQLALQSRPAARDRDQGTGSNNWVVSPSQTQGGHALLANDPHLGMENPAIWYLVSIDSKTDATGDIRVAGVSFAGLPGIILGQNDAVAWGATTTFFDQADVYLETVTNNGVSVSFEGQDVPVTVRQFTFNRTPPLTPVTENFLYVPHHGPMVAVDGQGGTGVSIRWVGHDATTDLNFLLPIMRAASLAEAKTALSNLTSTGQNFVVVDNAGNVGWFPYSLVPQRPWADQYPPWLPLPGTGEAEWDGFYPLEELPQVENPAAGFVATANNDMTGAVRYGRPGVDSRYLQHFVAAGYRHARIVELLEAAAGAHTVQTMQRAQADVYSLVGQDVVPVVLGLAAEASDELDENGARVRDVLEAWTHECPTGLTGTAPTAPADPDAEVTRESAGCMAFHALVPRLHRAVFADEQQAAGVSRRARLDSLLILLLRPEDLAAGTAYWDDVSTSSVTETSTQTAARVLNATGAYLVGQFGEDPADWRWGRKHTVTFNPAFGQLFTANGPYANDGGLFTVDVANPGGAFSDNYAHGAGPSMRMVCEAHATNGVSCTIELPGGQRTFRSSPFYDNLIPYWLRNEPIPLWYRATDVARESIETVEFKPAD